MVLDFGGNIERHGCVDNIEFEEKKERKGSGISIQPVKVCEKCREPNPIWSKICDYCFLEFPEIEREITHDKEAFEGAILSTDIKPKLIEINRVLYSRHKKAGKPDSLRVSYYKGVREMATEWVCLEHTGFAREKANKWWRYFYNEDAPKEVETALKVKPFTPRGIWVKKNGKYKEVMSYDIE